ncbi:SGNH/GDSL hydrolase family protein [Halalkalibacter alkalisediminis]|uniref:SGNH/GDSL hydrolase family protein n=1 Tax=Halalkalibacter alkalisediminis TaxID=935616 RepID=A0ABV6NIN0_9BACI|nr:SGNH/GDSL hydrolase family protein [Halalkalibacter alkalisediminis]
MQGKKAAIMIASLIVVCFLLYLFLPDFNQTKLEREKTVSSIIKGSKIENHLGDNVVEEEEQLVEENHHDKPITEQIKDKVREVVEGAINLVKKDQKIVAIGDSLTQGIGDETENGGYVGILNHTFEDHNLKLTVENFGKRGNRTDQLLKRLDQEEIVSSIKEADIILITIGANDIMKVVQNHFTNLTIEPFQEEKVGYIERLTGIFNKMNQLNPDTQIFLIGFYNPFERYFSEIEQLEMIVDDWNDAAKSVTEEFSNVYYIPTKDLFINSDLELLADDHFHPNTSGYKLVATRVLEYLIMFSEETEIAKENIEL